MAHDAQLEEALKNLQLPPAGVRALLDHLRSFCQKHGGKRRYGELLDLVRECEWILEAGDESGEKRS